MPESAKIAPAEPEREVPISGIWLAVGVFVRAYLASVPKRRRKAFIDMADGMVAALEASLATVPIKRSARGRERDDAARELVAWYRSARPYLLA